MDARTVQVFFLAAGTACLALGIPMLVSALNVVQYNVRYDNVGPFAVLDRRQQQELLWAAGDVGVETSVTISVDKDMEPPVRV
jgi:hypothetical protein